MAESSATGGWWDQSYPWTFPYVGDFPPAYPDKMPTITTPNTSIGWPSAGNPPFPSRQQIEKELLQKIAKELKTIMSYPDDPYGDGLFEWADEIVDTYGE